MPTKTGSQSLLASVPSFMSVFGRNLDSEYHQEEDAATETRALSRTSTITSEEPNEIHSVPEPTRRDSSPTNLSESTDSSPTTTISTVNSSITEPSPCSSPESPTSLIPLLSFEDLKTGPRKTSPVLMEPPQSLLPNPSETSHGDPPSKKLRNTRKLSVITSPALAPGQPLPQSKPSIESGSRRVPELAAPASPALFSPQKLSKKRPSKLGLTISTTDSNGQSSSTHHRADVIPQTPSDQAPGSLRSQIVTSHLELFSPTAAPKGGMQLPPFQKANNLDDVQEERSYDLPLSREIKPDGYPQGPICIYDSLVYLYLEPTEAVASQFDVIVNVAREVLNPFTTTTEAASAQNTDAQIDSQGVEVGFLERDRIPEPLTATFDGAYPSAFEERPEPTTSANDYYSKSVKKPEYVHVPWDHNTDVVDDLLGLCELIDDRVKKGKRVLVHCQCGVSRSASLIIAYGLYKQPELSVQQAYDAVKSRSEWIGPNMNLIYQLSDFKRKVERAFSPLSTSRRGWPPSTQGRSSSASLPTPSSKIALPAKSLTDPRPGPLSAPIWFDGSSTPLRPHSMAPSTSTSSQLADAANLGDMTPGPSSAPPKISWSPISVSDLWEQPYEPSRSPSRTMDVDADDRHSSSDTITQPATAKAKPSSEAAFEQPEFSNFSWPLSSALPGGFSSISIRRPAPRSLPLRQETPHSSASSIRTQHVSPKTDRFMTDDSNLPPTPSLLSPRAAEFTASPFHRTAAGDLAGSSFFEQAEKLEKETDPRSPVNEKDEAEILRSIDDML